MIDDVKGYVVRGTWDTGPVVCHVPGGFWHDRSPHVFREIEYARSQRGLMLQQGCTDVSIFRVHADGREERLPSYEEALAEIERLTAQHLADRAEMSGAMVEMKECARALDEAIEAHVRKDAEIERLRAVEALNVGAIDASLVRLGAVTGAIGPIPADPLAALEAAERRLLEAGGWREVEAGWQRPDDRAPECHFVAVTIERRRLAAKGGA